LDIPLRYGDGTTILTVPGRNVSGVYRPRPPAAAGAEGLLRDLPERAGAEALRRASRDRSVLFLVTDATRGEPHGEILATGLKCLDRPRRLTVAIATGSHRADTAGNRRIVEEAREAARRAGMPLEPVVVHDGRAARFTDHGPTRRGTPILLSDVLDGAEVLLAAGDIRHHYFAGYSNPTKNVLPGIAAFETIERNHSLSLEPDSTFGRHPWHPVPARRTNPVAEDMIEAFDRAVGDRPCFALVTVSSGGIPAHAELGPIREVVARGFGVADRLSSHRVPKTMRMVVSAGGVPMDTTLYLSQRAIELTRSAAADGAEILLLAECRDGIADGESALRNFYHELTRPLDEVLTRIRSGYRLYQHKAYKFAELLKRIGRLHLTSRLPEEQVRAAHLTPAPDPAQLVERWIREDPEVGITFFDEANRLCILEESGP
jgi:nickel-dependent lactate racemase